jgi:AraC-like DNA-binding protein
VNDVNCSHSKQESYQAVACDVLLNRGSGPAPPPEWAKALRQLAELSRAPVPPPSWWSLTTAYCANIETRTDPTSYYLEGRDRAGADDPPGWSFQLCLAGWGHFQLHGEQPQKVTPGKAFFALTPSRDLCCLPQGSPGWTYAWIRIHQPYLIARVAKQVAITGPLFDVPPDGELAASTLRLVRGAIKQDFRDRFDVELALFEFVLAYERWASQTRDNSGEGQRLLDEVRARIVASLPQAIDVHALASEYGMSRSHFSHLFRMRTGLTPAHFVTEVRVHEAARMLRETRASLGQIANQCGFADATHLCKVFRRVEHVSPMSYRRTIRAMSRSR